MDWPRLDARWWNLSLRTAAVATATACGPVVTIEEDSDTDPGECNASSDCGPGYACFEGECILYEYPYDDSYYCGDGTGGCCEGGCAPPDPECQDDLDCGPEGKCDLYYECVPFTVLPECQEELAIVPLELPFGTMPFLSLSFVDANGDAAQDLVVSRQGAIWLQLGPGITPPGELSLPPDVSMIDATAGDLDGDGDADLVVSTLEGHLVTLAGDGNGGFDPVAVRDVGDTLVDLTTLQWDLDGFLDVAAVGLEGTGTAYMHFGSGTGEILASVELATSFEDVASLAAIDFDGDAYGDVLVQDQISTQLFLGSVEGDVVRDQSLPGEAPSSARQLVTGPIDGTAPAEVVGHVLTPTWAEIAVWRNAQGFPDYYKLENAGRELEIGDVDGDGSSDVVVGNDEVVTYLRGDPDGPLSFSCQSTYLTGVPLAAMAMGDLDGNGRADVALGTTDGVVVVLMSQ